jgi:hypothetical protein
MTLVPPGGVVQNYFGRGFERELSGMESSCCGLSVRRTGWPGAALFEPLAYDH